MLKKLSKKQKVLGTLILVVVVIAAAFFAYKTHQHTEYLQSKIINGLFDDYAFYSPYDEDSRDDYVEFFNEGIRKSSIRKALAQTVSNQTEVALLNTTYYDTSKEDRHGMSTTEDQFGEEPTLSSLRSSLPEVIGALTELGYEDESLRDNLYQFYVQDRQYEIDHASEETDPIVREYRVATAMDAGMEAIDEFNQAAGDFYQIDRESIYPVSELEDHYTQAIDLSYDQKDAKQLAKALSAAMESDYAGDQTYLDSKEILDFFTADATDLATTVNGIGGYYDTQDPEESGSYYGDFYYRTKTSGGNRYDTSAFTPGLWSALSPGQRAEIRSGNSTHTATYRYFCGESIDNFAIMNVDNGEKYQYAFVIPGQEWGFVFISPRSICLDLKDIGQVEIPGDFEDSFEQVRQDYAATHGGKLSQPVDEAAEEAAEQANLARTEHPAGLTEQAPDTGAAE